jgi:hypothetical protein
VIPRDLELDNGWVSYTNTSRRLRDAGYTVGGYIDNGVSKYVLYRLEQSGVGVGMFTIVHEFDTPEELTIMVKLLIPEEN